MYVKMKLQVGVYMYEVYTGPSPFAPAPAFGPLIVVMLSLDRHEVSGKGVCP